MNTCQLNLKIASSVRSALVRLIVICGLGGTQPAFAETLSRSIDVSATPTAIWSAIGPFCAIKEWLPPVGSCTEDGKFPPTRTLVTKDGTSRFVEMQTRRDDADQTYSYTFVSSPLPVTNYVSTLKVAAKNDGVSTVIWSSTYTPNSGQAQDVSEALRGIYESGLAAIKARFEK